MAGHEVCSFKLKGWCRGVWYGWVEGKGQNGWLVKDPPTNGCSRRVPGGKLNQGVVGWHKSKILINI